MKPFSRLPVSAVALAAFFVLGMGLTRAQDDLQARKTTAEGLLTAMHTEQMVDGTMTRLQSFVDRFHQNAVKGTLTPEQSGAIQKAEDEARDTIKKELGYAGLKNDFVEAYADAFSGQELKELTAFYNSPLGQKLVEKQPALNAKIGQMAQQKSRTVMSGVVQKLQEVARKNMPTPTPIPATVVPAPISPAAIMPPVSAVTPPVPAIPATTPGVPPVASTPASTTTPVPAMPTPPPSPTAAGTPAAQ